jgi:hypothetical protein
VALVTYAPLVTAVKGSIGGITFQANTAGHIARARSRPRRSRTNVQHTSQAKLLVWLPQWRALDLATQQDWSALAAAHPITDFYGRTRQLTGFNLFARCNSQLAIFGVAPITNAPAWAPPDPLTSAIITLSADHLFVDWTPDPLPADIGTVMYLTPPVWRSQTPFRQHMRFVFIGPPNIAGGWDIENPWSAKFQVSWPPIGYDNMSIQFGVYPVDTTNGLTASAQFASAQLPVP